MCFYMRARVCVCGARVRARVCILPSTLIITLFHYFIIVKFVVKESFSFGMCVC